jgi:hypothetical protein
MSYRPITDVWILARPKVKYYGAYPSGFLSRARELLGVHEEDPVLHVCGGLASKYPFRGFGPNDCTLDIHTELNPDIVHDVRKPIQGCAASGFWPAIIADPPYTIEDAKEYNTEDSFPEPSKLLRTCLDAVRPGGRVGFLHYIWPRPPKTARSVAAIGVIVGFGNRIRIYSVFERIK